MMRLSDKQYRAIYDQLQKNTQEYTDNKYPCGDGGWIHYRVTCMEHFDDIKILLLTKQFADSELFFAIYLWNESQMIGYVCFHN